MIEPAPEEVASYSPLESLSSKEAETLEIDADIFVVYTQQGRFLIATAYDRGNIEINISIV